MSKITNSDPKTGMSSRQGNSSVRGTTENGRDDNGRSGIAYEIRKGKYIEGLSEIARRDRSGLYKLADK